MAGAVIRVYEYLRRHRAVCVSSFLLVTLVLSFLLSGQSYKEDISDFLPLNNKYNKALKVYQDISGANRIFAIVQYADTVETDPDSIVLAVDAFVDHLQAADEGPFIDKLTYQIDIEQVADLSAFVYHNIPYFLTASDYDRFDSLLTKPDHVATQLAIDKQMLMFPAADFLAENMQRDPLNLFMPVVRQLQQSSPNVAYENYDGYIFTPDLRRAIIMMETPFGASETEKNGQLLSLLEETAGKVSAAMPQIDIQFTGGPVIAVGNAKQIKTDSLLSICIALLLIVALLFWTFRNTWNLLLIIVSIAWGWLFAMGALALLHDSVSVIVVGISSVILGIAVNYPLHLIAHLQHTTDVKSALKEIATPLVIGNITTVGAFLALVPLKSVALRDLGLFSSLLLIGTILFVLMYLPHLLRSGHRTSENIISRIGSFSLDDKRWIVYAVAVLTLVFGYFSLDTVFDSNMNHINYMSEEQRANMDYFQSLLTKGDQAQKVYVVSQSDNLDTSLAISERLAETIDRLQADGDVSASQSCSQFICSAEEQQRRLALWQAFVTEYGEALERDIRREAKAENFQDDVFDDFFAILHADYPAQPVAFFAPLTAMVFGSNLTADEQAGTYSVIRVLSTDKDNVGDIIGKIESCHPECYAFDVQGMNSSIATRLSDDFNYIGWACGLIVFFFLWLSFGSLELAMLSFLPMTVSWVWILGIMAILGIHFNVVNIILATFIFGQGDDYTIFMTEGCQYEYAYRRKMLASYKNSIVISALIMFIGIGALIFAKHPALRSLAEVTIVGMFSVVLMAYLIPPLIYRWLVSACGQYRFRPISLRPLFVTFYSAVVFFCQLATVYVLGFVLFVLTMPTGSKKRLFRNYIRRCFWFDMHHIWGVPFTFDNPFGEDFSTPTVVVCNHQSMLDTAYLMAMSPKIAIVSNSHASDHLIIKKVAEWMDFYTIPPHTHPDEHHLRGLIAKGYSIVVFPEGKRNPGSSILRFHKGAFYFAEKYGLDIVPVILHGVNHVMPRNSICTYSGEVTLRIGRRIRRGAAEWGTNYVEQTRLVHQYYVEEYDKLKQQKETADYYASLVIDRYRYKGRDICTAVKKGLDRHANYASVVDKAGSGLTVVVNDSGWGELPMLLGLTDSCRRVIAVEADEEKRCVAEYACEGIADNITFLDTLPPERLEELKHTYGAVQVVQLNP